MGGLPYGVRRECHRTCIGVISHPSRCYTRIQHSGMPGDKGGSAGSSGDKGASAGGKKKQAGPGINRKAKVDALVSRASKDDGSLNPDDALASRNPEDVLIPDVSAVWARAKKSVARAAVDGADCDAPKSFEQWVLALTKPEQEELTESYLHYTAAQEE